jgi:predicted RNA-binding protein with RPS1 domain
LAYRYPIFVAKPFLLLLKVSNADVDLNETLIQLDSQSRVEISGRILEHAERMFQECVGVVPVTIRELISTKTSEGTGQEIEEDIEQQVQLTLGSVYDATVTNVVSYGAFVRISEGYNGLIHKSQLIQDVEDIETVLQRGDELKVELTKIEPHNRLGFRVSLSVGQVYKAEVISVASYGIFVRIPGGRGLVHRSRFGSLSASQVSTLRPSDKIDIELIEIGDDGKLDCAMAGAIAIASVKPRELLSEGRIEEAIIAYSKKIDEQPKSYGNYVGRARAKYMLGDIDGALEDMELAKTVNSRDKGIDRLMEKMRTRQPL